MVPVFRLNPLSEHFSYFEDSIVSSRTIFLFEQPYMPSTGFECRKLSGWERSYISFLLPLTVFVRWIGALLFWSQKLHFSMWNVIKYFLNIKNCILLLIAWFELTNWFSKRTFCPILTKWFYRYKSQAAQCYRIHLANWLIMCSSLKIWIFVTTFALKL